MKLRKIIHHFIFNDKKPDGADLQSVPIKKEQATTLKSCSFVFIGYTVLVDFKLSADCKSDRVGPMMIKREV